MLSLRFLGNLWLTLPSNKDGKDVSSTSQNQTQHLTPKEAIQCFPYKSCRNKTAKAKILSSYDAPPCNLKLSTFLK